MRNILIRRRKIKTDSQYNWQPLQTLPYTQWSKANGVTTEGDFIVFRPTGLNWSCHCTSQVLKYNISQMPSFIVRLSFDYELYGNVSNGYIAFSAGAFSSSNNTKNATRQAFYNIVNLTSGSGHRKVIVERTNWNTTPNQNYFFGTRIYAYTGNGSVVKLSNITFDVHVP